MSLTAGLFIFLFTVVATQNVQGVSSIAQGFQTDGTNVIPGALVGLKQRAPNTVELSNSENLDRIVGVAGDKSVIELSNGAASIQVVTNGITTALVSDINGGVKTGDKVTASPIAGVGMRATTSTLIIGTAQADLKGSKTETRTITDKKGNEQKITIGSIALQVDKVFYEAPHDENTFLPPVLQDFADSIAGRRVSAVRVMIAGLLMLFLFASITILLYSAVRSSIISIGRNPLSERAVHKSLLNVGITVVIILLFTSLVIYFILTA